MSHRLPIAEAARDAGADVVVVTRVNAHGGVISDHGLRVVPWNHARGGTNPFAELVALWDLVRIYRRERPSVAHHVALKPVIYGSLAARLAGTPHVVNALAGMGALFTRGSGWKGLLRPLVRGALRQALRSGIALVQNPDDRDVIRGVGVPANRIAVVGGSGVDLRVFMPQPEPPGVPVVVLPARLLWNKGVGEFVEASRLLARRGIVARFVLAGEPDDENPSTISRSQIAAWVGEGLIEHVGWVTNMPGLLASAHIVCLPSYREGMPKALLEASAAGRPIVTSDTTGCRDVVRHGDNGLLVPVGDSARLADALATLLTDPGLRASMGRQGRVRAEAMFGLEDAVRQTLALYRTGAA